MTNFKLAPYCVGCLPALHAPLYAALGTGVFRAAGIDVRFLSEAPKEERLLRLRDGTADLALMDLASLVDATASDPELGARCVFVLTQRSPMAAHVVVDGPAGTRVGAPDDLLRARYGGDADSPFVAEHRALLRRLGGDDPALRVDMPYERLFGALAKGEIEAAPDFGGTDTRFARAARPIRTGLLPYRDCGVDAYGIGFVASSRGMSRHGERMATVIQVIADAYERMRRDPVTVVAEAARVVPDLDQEYALAEWHDEEATAIFGYGAETSGIGGQDATGWTATIRWRQEVTGGTGPSVPVRDLFEPL